MTSKTTTPRAIARRAGCSEYTVRRACVAGELPAEQHDRRWIVLADDAERWIRSYRRYARKARNA